jgi:HD superfamily phosphohydrolase YqeK
MKQVGLATYLPLQGKTLTEQMVQYLEAFDHAETAVHNLAVAQEAKGLAGLLHDVSVVIPNDQRIALQIAVGEPILDAERQAPFLLHQQQSALLAKTVFQVSDPEILSAISCHTTLKAQYSRLDLIVFLADKIKWDRKDQAPFLTGLLERLDDSLESAAGYYMDWLFAGDLVVPHPWAVAAKAKLANT